MLQTQEGNTASFIVFCFVFLAHTRVRYSSCLARREEKRDAKMPSESWKAVLSAPKRWLLLQAQLSLLWLPRSSLLLLSPYLWGQATCGQAACSFCSCWAPLMACWGGSLIVPSNAGEAAQPLHPTSLTSPCHAPTGAGAGLSQTCFGGPQHNTGFIRASPGALIWDTPQQPVMNPHTRVRVQRGGERSQLYPVYRVAASFMSRLKASWPAPAQE